MTRSARTIIILISLLLVASNIVWAQQPYSKAAPLWLDFDMENIAEPEEFTIKYAADFMHGNIMRPVKETFNISEHVRRITGNEQQAYNVNTLDEVPDSSWFTNRNGRRALTIDEIKRGPNKSDGPQGKLTIVKGKSAGATPGFTVRDERGDLYILKFDPPDYPELASAAEVIATKLFYAGGYNVPENYILHFRRDQLAIDAKATLTIGSSKRALTEADLDQMLARVARQSDGQYRCAASKLLAGKVKGGFKFFGVRKDDANDIIPHEHRRDLRGLRLFCAWLNHNDMRVENTLDMYVSESGRNFLRHYLIDFGSTLGSETVRPNHPRAGHEYNVDYQQSARMMFSLGIYQPDWLKKRELRYPSVGFYNAEEFEPASWKPVIPQPAFANMTDRDGYWAARIIASFSDDQIRAAVASGELSDPDAAAYLSEQIIKRRDKIVRHYLYERPGFDSFQVEHNGARTTLRFADLRARLLGERNAVSYQYEISAVKGEKFARGTIDNAQLDLTAPLLQQIAKSDIALIKIKRKGESMQSKVYVWNDQGTLRIVGIEY